MKELTVIDFFCGAGGFSEGFRQQGFDVVMGLDHWRPAVESHNLNHGLEDEPVDILRFGDPKVGRKAIDALPDTDVIVGSPPCVSFSMSNKAGKADKSLGIRLIESFLRVVAVKKHKPDSILKAWFMENVPNSRNFVQPVYTFADLGLASWAREHHLNPKGEALRVRDNGAILCAADYGSPQSRQRFVAGEWLGDEDYGAFPMPDATHASDDWVTLGDIRHPDRMPAPLRRQRKEWIYQDPNYPWLEMLECDVPDQHYDTGVYRVEWRSARFAKRNHPFMGRMSFPEDPARPARTIMATRSASTREALLFRSERKRKGDGEYRLPTVREAATLMGFPWCYQFVGSEGTKWKQIGNAVCPHMSAALAAIIRWRMGFDPIDEPGFGELMERLEADRRDDLNDFKDRVFDNPPKRKATSKFRRHPFKDGNMTIALTNFRPDLEPVKHVGKNWHAVAYLGAGKTYRVQVLTEWNRLAAWKVLEQALGPKAHARLLKEFTEEFLPRIADGEELSRIYASNDGGTPSQHPVDVVDELAEFLEPYDPEVRKLQDVGKAVVDKADIHLRQVMAVATICEIAKKASPEAWEQLSRSKGRVPAVQSSLFPSEGTASETA